MTKTFTLKVRDKEGKEWIYEGDLQGVPIFTRAEKGQALAMTFNEAKDVLQRHYIEGETSIQESA